MVLIEWGHILFAIWVTDGPTKFCKNNKICICFYLFQLNCLVMSTVLNGLMWCICTYHYNDVTMNAMASQIISLRTVYSTIYSGAEQRKHQSSTSLAFVRGNHWSPVNFPHKGPVTRKKFPFDDVTMYSAGCFSTGNFCVWAQPIRDNTALYHYLLLA